MTRYTEIIVNQGRGIVTTLEHIKHYFLCNGTPINQADGGNKLRKIHIYNEKNKQQCFYKSNTEEQIKTLIDNSKTYDVKSSDGAIETVEQGYMMNIGFVKQLNILGGLEDEVANNLVVKKENGEEPYLGGESIAGNVFIMLACIRRETRKDSADNKYNKSCIANLNTMELSQALTSKDKIDDVSIPTDMSLVYGGGIKTRKNKKPRKQNKIKTRKNQY